MTPDADLYAVAGAVGVPLLLVVALVRCALSRRRVDRECEGLAQANADLINEVGRLRRLLRERDA